MKVKEVVSSLRNRLKEYYADNRLSNRFLWNIVWSVSKLLIHREKNSIYDLNVFKTYNIKTEEVNLLETSCVPLNCMGCRFKIPKGIDNKYGLIYRFLASPDLSKNYRIVTPNSFQRKKKIRGNNANYAYRDGDYIYIDECIPCVKISVIPDNENDIIDVENGCSFLEQTSPIPDHLLNSIFRMGVEELGFYVRKPFDTSTNKNPNA